MTNSDLYLLSLPVIATVCVLILAVLIRYRPGIASRPNRRPRGGFPPNSKR
ncbi:hypothetical protein [Rhodopseudomonas palustris]|uniref:hypothetical protein n=1 Tax=Rhodopseudomonas palustris TaxID=1076 RepID=UPI0012EED7DA